MFDGENESENNADCSKHAKERAIKVMFSLLMDETICDISPTCDTFHTFQTIFKLMVFELVKR